jgi:tRNA1Val (adenine37-N6)-methyltransferase
MAKDYFNFKRFTIRQERAAFKVGTDGVLLGACADLSCAKNILDIGTGTGLIAIMAAQRSPAVITAIEPDEGSYNQAVENVKECPWPDRINVFKSDLKSFADSQPGNFDIIITNPPFFRDSLLNPDRVKSSTRHSYSLSSDDILEASTRLLKDDGNLQLILPYEEATLFIAEAGIKGFYCNRVIKVKPNPSGNIIRMILKFERIKKPVYEKFLTIETGTRHRYTEEYREATKEFYLNF